MQTKVTRLELSQLDDGRQQLLIEFHDGRRSTVEWYGDLTADYLNPYAKAALVLDLCMKVRPGSGNDIASAHWARLTVEPPRQPGCDLLIGP